MFGSYFLMHHLPLPSQRTTTHYRRLHLCITEQLLSTLRRQCQLVLNYEELQESLSYSKNKIYAY